MKVSYPRRRLRTFAAAILFALGGVMVSLAPGAASTGTDLSVGGGSSSAGGSFSTSTSVSLAAPDELNAFDVTLSYNSSVAVPTSVTLNGSWSIPLDPGTIGAGTIHVAASRLGFCTVSCPLFSVNWSAVGPGSFQSSPTSYVLSGRQSGVGGNLTSTSASAATITVNGPSNATATNTAPASTATNTPIPPTATNTAIPTATNTTVQGASTPVTPTSTPIAGTTASPSTATPVPAPVNPTAAPTAPVVISAPSSPSTGDPPPNGPVAVPPAGSESPPAPAPSSPNPRAQAPFQPAPSNAANPVVNSAPGLSSGPSGHAIPLPPRAGTGPVIGNASPLKGFGFGLMALSALFVLLEYARGRQSASPRTFSVALDEYLDAEQSRARERRG